MSAPQQSDLLARLGEMEDELRRLRLQVVGSPGVAVGFSSDGVTTDDERIKFISQESSVIDRSRIDTKTVSGDSSYTAIAWRLSRTSVTSGVNTGVNDTEPVLVHLQANTGRGALQLKVKAPFGTNQHHITISDSVMSLQMQGPGGGWTGSNRIMVGCNAQGEASPRVGMTAFRSNNTFEIQGAEFGAIGKASIYCEYHNTTTPSYRIFTRINGVDTLLVDDSGASANWMRYKLNTASSTSGTQVIRGPFVASPGAIAASGTASVVVSNALKGIAPTVMGTVQGAAGVEQVLVSWVAGPLANQVTINFRNLDAASAHTPTYSFMTVGDP